MNPELQKLLEQNFSGTLADFRRQAAKELNGTAWRALRGEGHARSILVVCMTGAHEIAKSGLKPANRRPVDWHAKSLMEGVAMALVTRQIIYQEELSAGQLSAVLFIAADPASITYLERRFNLPA